MQNKKKLNSMQNTKPKPNVKLIESSYNTKQIRPFFGDSKKTHL